MAILNNSQVRLTLKYLGDEIRAHGVVRADKPMKLSSGKYSNYYFDVRTLLGNPEFHMNLTSVLYAQYRRFKLRSVGGIESGSIPIAYLYSAYSYAEEAHVSAFYIRKNLKSHGSKQWTEGVVRSPCLIFEDVITTGNSVIKAVTMLKKSYPEIKILGITSVIDRTEDNCLNVRRYTGLQVSSLFKYNTLIPAIKNQWK